MANNSVLNKRIQYLEESLNSVYQSLGMLNGSLYVINRYLETIKDGSESHHIYWVIKSIDHARATVFEMQETVFNDVQDEL